MKKEYLGRCHCGELLQREYSPAQDIDYICCPVSHYMPGHMCIVDDEVI